MKKITFITLALLSLNQIQAQYRNSNHFFEDLSVDLGYGISLPFSPSSNISTSDYTSYSNFQIGANYQIDELYGIKLSYANHNFQNKHNKSFGINYNKIILEATLSTFNALNLNYTNNNIFDVIAHTGVGVTFAKNENKETEKMLNFQLGFTPTYKISNSFNVFFDITGVANFKQDYGYNGVKLSENNKTGFYLSTMLGLKVNLGEL